MNQNFYDSNSFGFDQIQPPQQFVNHQPQEIPEVIPFMESKEWFETKNELYKMIEAYTERINQQREQEALLAAQREQELRVQEQAAQREQELLAQKQAAQEKYVPSSYSIFHQLIKEMCGTNASAEQKQKLEEMMLELLELCWEKELYCEKQEVKNIVEQATKRRTHITESLQNFTIIHKKSSISLNNTPQISPDEVIKSSVENLVPIPSESEGISDDTCDVPFCDNSLLFDALKDHVEIFSDSNDDGTSSDDDTFEDIEYVEASPPNPELVSLEEVNVVDQEKEEINLEDILRNQDVILCEKLLNINRLIDNIESLNDNSTPDCVLKSPSPFHIPVEDSDSFFEKSDTSLSYSDNSLPEFETFKYHTEETSSGSTTTHVDNSFPEYDSFHFEIEPDQGELSIVVMEDILGEPRVHMPNVLPTHTTLMLDSDFILSDDSLGSDLKVSFPSGTRNKFFDPGIFFEVQSKRFLSRDTFSPKYVSLPFKDRHYLSFAYVIQIFLSYFTYPVVSPFLLSSGSEDTIFDPGISAFHFSLEPVAFKCPMEVCSSTCVPDEEPAYNEDEANLQRALELSLKEQSEQTQGPARPVVIREPDSGRIQPLLNVQGKVKEKVVDEKAAHDLLTLQNPKKKSPADQFIFQRRTPIPTEASRHAESPSLDAKLALTDNEGQAGSNPGDAAESQPQSSHVVHAGPNLEHMDLGTTDASTQQNPEQMDEEFTTTAYPNVSKNLKLPTEDQVIIEELASSTGTLSSLQNLDKELRFTD
ncbi:ribonuclease H-like domain-containing protein [Tanacetum coccineum]|uniref:Ribonuclease H-like domain-containing protein n=1 Tax=Tanacetum coccineum TaxID=301880 RepID=A0ABQ5J3D2_9ASTR